MWASYCVFTMHASASKCSTNFWLRVAVAMHACAGECSIPYARRLQSAGNPNYVPSSPSWYSFDHGNIHFIGYSTEIDFSPGSAQYKCAPFPLTCGDFQVIVS